MRIIRTWMLAGAVAAAVGCSSDSSTPTGTGTGGTGGNGGGAVGAVTVGNDFFQSAHNGTRPAQDTVAVGQTVTWTWTNTGGTAHSVEALPLANPSFTSSNIMQGNGTTYSFTFTAPGTYPYQCAVHGAIMSGTVVVQ
jgi:plastocyanin